MEWRNTFYVDIEVAGELWKDRKTIVQHNGITEKKIEQ